MLPLSLAIVCNAFPAARAGPRARHLGGDLGGGAGDRPARRRRPGRSRLAADLLDQPADRRDRDRDHGRWRRRSRPIPAPARRIDFAGLLALAVGLTAVVLALVQARAWGGGADRRAGRCCGLVLASTPSGGSSTASREPIVDFALFRNGPYFGASAAAFALVGAYWAVMFFQPQYLQDVRGHSAVLSGLMILPVTVPMIFISPFSGRLIARFGARGADDRRDGLRHCRACSC